MRQIFKRTADGEATDLQSWPEEKALPNGFLLHGLGDELPPIEDLHTPEFLLASVRAKASRSIDVHAEAARLRYITPGSGQAMTYLEKRSEAQAYKDAGYPSASLLDYPMVKAEKDGTGVTGRAAADLILAKAAEWVVLAAAIDKERRSAKFAVEAATDVATIEPARDAALAALELI